MGRRTCGFAGQTGPRFGPSASLRVNSKLPKQQKRQTARCFASLSMTALAGTGMAALQVKAVEDVFEVFEVGLVVKAGGEFFGG